jgi:[ribosomal protein S18]-alanine N-acetyltransferase
MTRPREACSIRGARLGDIEGILALEQLFETDRVSRRALRRFLRVPSASVWVAVGLEGVLGSCILLTKANTARARIYSLIVSPRARGQGLASRLLEAAERAARRAGCDWMVLEVARDNHAARALYEKRGYRWQRALSAYYEDGSDGDRLEKPLRRQR